MIRLKNLLMEAVIDKGDSVTISERTMVTAMPIELSEYSTPLSFYIRLAKEQDDTYKVTQASIKCELFKLIGATGNVNLDELNRQLWTKFGKNIRGWSGPEQSLKTAIDNVNNALNERIPGAGVFTYPDWMDPDNVSVNNINARLNAAGYGTAKQVDFGMAVRPEENPSRTWNWNSLQRAGAPVTRTGGGQTTAARTTISFTVHTIKHPENNRILFYRMKFAEGGNKWFMLTTDGKLDGKSVQSFSDQFREQSGMVTQFLNDIFADNDFKSKVMADTRTK